MKCKVLFPLGQAGRRMDRESGREDKRQDDAAERQADRGLRLLICISFGGAWVVVAAGLDEKRLSDEPKAGPQACRRVTDPDTQLVCSV
ncbi:hypothetical protein GQ53DRAFT_354763 [Thozetella sp. PMI_491]|nr:hypothetical protein GQ53DRAFT_354763 [Thozetella sp. PMI_491]